MTTCSAWARRGRPCRRGCGTIEGPTTLSAVKATELHDDPAGYQARGLSTPYRALTYNYVLRPVTARANAVV